MSLFRSSRSRATLRSYLTAGYALFIVYASLSPFTGWQEQGLSFTVVLLSPLAQTYTWFDAIGNFLSYLPFGFLLGLTLRRQVNASWSVLLATVAGMLLSGAMEYAQMYLPSRISSNFDLLVNTLAMLFGALLAVSIIPRAWFFYLLHWRFEFFRLGALVDFGLALVALWMFAQINPSLPILGNVFITEIARQPFVPPKVEPFNWLESIAVTLNSLMLGILLLTLLRSRQHAVGGFLLVLCAVVLVKFIAAVMLLKSWALLLWLNGEALLGISVGVATMMLLGRLAQPSLLHLGSVIAGLYILLTNIFLDSGSPSAAMRLYHLRYGHLLTYNGLSQSIMMIFPLLLLAYSVRGGLRNSADKAASPPGLK